MAKAIRDLLVYQLVRITIFSVLRVRMCNFGRMETLWRFGTWKGEPLR